MALIGALSAPVPVGAATTPPPSCVATSAPASATVADGVVTVSATGLAPTSPYFIAESSSLESLQTDASGAFSASFDRAPAGTYTITIETAPLLPHHPKTVATCTLVVPA